MRLIVILGDELSIPDGACDALGWRPGDNFEIVPQDTGTFMLRRVPPAPERGWLEVLQACPGALELPGRERDDSPPVEL